MSDVRSNWWVRNFNLIFTVRFIVISILIYNLQYLQVFQVLGSLFVILAIFAYSLKICFKMKFFKSKFTKVFRLIQEGSFTVIMILINIFYFDSERKFIKN